MNTAYILRLQQSQTQLRLYARVYGLIKSGHHDQIKQKVDVLNEDLAGLRHQFEYIECRLDAHAAEGRAIMSSLRQKKDSFTSEAGKQREILIANIHQEEQWKNRLAVLRGEKIQKLQMLNL